MARVTSSRSAVSFVASPVSLGARGAFWLAVLWAVALSVVFFKYRGDDVGRLPELFASFASQFRGFSGTALGNSVLGGIIAILVVLSWAGIGALIEGLLDRLDPADSQCTAWRWAVRCAWGAGVSSLLWFFLGLAGLYIWPVALGVLLCGLLLFIRAWRVDHFSIHSFVSTSAKRTWDAGTDGEPSPGPRTAKEPDGIIGRFAFALAVAAMLLAGIASLCPPTAKDTLLYHIALPKAFVAARGLADVPNNIAQYYPLGGELNGTWGILLGRPAVSAGPATPAANLTSVGRPGEAAFGGIEFAYLPVLALAIYGWSRRRGFTRDMSWVAVALVVCVPTVYASASSGYNDIALALYLTLAIAAAEEFWRNPSRRTAAEIGLAIGFALGIKLLALFLAAPLLVLFLLRMRSAEKQDIQGISVSAVFRRGLLAIALAAVLAGPWYVRNWARTGSPVYPFYINLFGGHAPGWDETRSLLDQVLNSRYGGYPKSALDYVAVPVRASLLAQPEIPRYFDGVLGISFLFGLPFLLIRFPFPVSRSPARNWGRTTAGGKQGTGTGQRAWIALILAGGFFAFWLFSSEQLRYLLPALPAVAVAIVGAVSAFERRQRVLLLATVAPGILVILAWFLQQNPVPVLIGAESRQSYLERRVDHYAFYAAANRLLPAQARVWLIDMRGDTYYLDRPYFFDFRIEHYTLMQWVRASATVEELRQRARDHGIGYVLARTDLLLDYATSPIVDDARSREENLRKLQLLQEFLFGGEVLQRDQHFVLFRVG
jgi:hypothetical protein